MTISERVQSPVVRPVYVGWLDIKDDPVFGWTGLGAFAPSGTGDPVLDTNIFVSAEGAVDITSIGESTGGVRAVTLVYTAHDNDAALARQIIRDRRSWQLRRAKLWLFFLMDDEVSVHTKYQQLFSGVIASANVDWKPGARAAVTLELDADLRAAAAAETRLIDHQRWHASDTFSTFIVKMANGALASARSAGSGNGGASGSRGGGLRLRRDKF